MGYFSKVKIIVSEEGYKELNRFLENKKNEKDNFLTLADSIKEDLRNHTIEIEWESIRWYSGYKGVQAIEEGLDHLNAYGFSYEYGIIGEEEDDIEIEHNNGTEDTKLPTLFVRREFDTYW